MKSKIGINTLLSALFQLGLANVTTVFLYRLALRLQLMEICMPVQKGYNDLLFSPNPAPDENLHLPVSNKETIEEAQELCNGKLRLFSHHLLYIGSPPNWFVNPLNGRQFPHPELHWSRLSDFELDVGDIKCIWELSRFDWALLLARAYRLTCNETYLSILNEWISNWTEKNPLHIGPNWKCGQETAIRMMQVLLAAYLLHQHRTPTAGLRRFVTDHCMRIAPTIRYAIAQNNNHGTSEAAGLYIGGVWLAACPQNDKKRRAKLALRWHQLGRRWLENRVHKLVAPDGSFSQYSLNYHRVLLDTLNIVEFWRRELQLPEFSRVFYERVGAAVEWLYQMVDPKTGDGPNLGANDGARLFVLSATDYRDYRPSVQLGAVLFLGGRVYPEGPWDEPLSWLGLDRENSPSTSSLSLGKKESEDERNSFCSNPSLKGDLGECSQAILHPPYPPQGGNKMLNSTVLPPMKVEDKSARVDLRFARKSCIMLNGGYVIMHFALSDGKVSWGLIRFPNFRFRPSHTDALHLDLWYDGVNLLRDAGTYSYNVDEPWQSYFPGTAAHNTIQFDGRDQMPRLSRFLFGQWLRMEQIGDLITDDPPLEEPVLSPFMRLSKGFSKGGREILSPLEEGREEFLSWTGSYVDYKKCRHKRMVSSNGLVWKIVDEIKGFDTKAVLRWRLAPGRWQIDGLTCVGELAKLSVDCTTSITRFELVEGWESRYYMEKTRLPALEVQVERGKTVLTTEICLRD